MTMDWTMIELFFNDGDIILIIYENTVRVNTQKQIFFV